MTSTAAFEACRPRLVAVAYGMLGDRGEAEDVVQDTWLRFADADEDAIRNPEAFLTTIATRLAIDRLRSARARRETYVGPWLPEPIVRDLNPPTPPDPADVVAEAEQFSLALLVALERLNPVERAVFLLRDVFDLDYDEIADVVDKTPSNCRQLARRAREHVGEPARRQPISEEEEQRVFTAFLAAATSGDVQQLMAVLAEDANTYSDGGGVVQAARKVIFGGAKSARFVIGIQRKLGYVPEYRLVRVNGELGVHTIGPPGVLSVLAVEIADGRVANLRVVNNPEKLTRV